ncbi:putative EF-hand domain, sodium/calcium exchanger membrane region, EF-hand domain pair [Helianthus annuus]|nr:putative EF-hand domain, sodium/calcium exchanger membrane region, EF-hand domain pair [Helianthus annuus]KAJ0847659.1 putative guanylate cyclase activating protein [Helianthus annuus]KAJ0856591.1 putative EF-hand domain, sodium/calcium exchanger membrane region, EF-hand domain pair [Helianthus annuus]
MGKVFAKVAFYSAFALFLLVDRVISRHLQYNAVELASNGVSDGREDGSIIRFKTKDSSEEECMLMYGFLPCSTNIPSHLFLIVIYEYLLYHGESYAGGDGRIFRVLGKNFYVTSFSQLLDALPDSLILLVTGLASSKEKAQEYVLTGAGLLAGSSILLLTLLWGACFICGRREFYVQPGSEVKNKAKQLLSGSGVLTDAETSFDAKVMFFSLIPFLVILLPSVFGLSYSSEEYKTVLLVSLSSSIICLISYFYYQSNEPKLWKRRLLYAEVEQKVEMHVSFYDVQELVLDRGKHLMIRDKNMEKRLKNLESEEQTSEMIKEWVDDTRKLMDTDPYTWDRTDTEYNQVAELLLEEKNTLMAQIRSMMEHASEQELLKDGTPDESAIDTFFELIDANDDKSITRIELKHFIMQVNNEKILIDDKIAEIMMRHLDVDRDEKIDKDEFKSGVVKLLTSCNSEKQAQYSNQKTNRYKTKEMFKAIILLIVGIFMLIVLAEPLVESVRRFSESVNIEPFYVSFILVPLATNARTAIAAIRAANQKRHKTTSLTFSEIYHKVFLNNILGFCVLVSVIYFRGFTWHFSAEIVVVVFVCIIMGLLASLKSKFPDWTLLIAFPLYPLSMVVVYFVNDAFQFS